MYVLEESIQTDIDLLTWMRTMSQIVEDKCKKPFIQPFCLQDQLKATVPWFRQTSMLFIWHKPASKGLFSVLKERRVSVWHCHFNATFMWRNHWSSHVNLWLATEMFLFKIWQSDVVSQKRKNCHQCVIKTHSPSRCFPSFEIFYHTKC